MAIFFSPSDDHAQQVEQKYLANIYVDDLPIYGPVGDKNKENGFVIFVNHK